MNLLITGFAGHIGTALIEKLSKNKRIKKIYCIDNFSHEKFYILNKYNSKKIKIIVSDILDFNFSSLKKLDICIHLAAITNAEKSFENKSLVNKNLEMTKKMINFCSKNKIKLLFPSSTSVYGISSNKITENHDKINLQPQSPYAITKIKEEKLIKKDKKLNFFIFRLGTIFGKSLGMRFHTAINKFCLQATLGKKLTVWKKNYFLYRPYLDLIDFVNLVNQYVNNKLDLSNRETYNLVSENIKLSDVIVLLKKISKKKVKVSLVNTKMLNQNSYIISNDKIISCGFKFTGELRRGIKETMLYLKNE